MNSVNLLLILMPLGLGAGMIAAAMAGHHLAVARRRRLDAEATVGTSAIDAAVLGLLGLLVAFWFSSAGTRLDTRRSLIVEEANSIGTAWLRLDLLPQDVEGQLRDLFRQYVDAHTPTAILVLLLAVGILSALLAGHDMGCQGTFDRLHVGVFAGVVSLTIWVIYDLEMPRYGLIRIDNFDKTMLDVRADFQWPGATSAP
jgi:hypothetical protein